MKKMFIILVILLSFSCVTSAYKNEYVDSRHDFKATKSIFIEFINDPSIDEFSVRKSYSVYENKIIKGLLPELRKGGINFYNIYDVSNDIAKETGMNIFSVYQSNSQYANKIKFEYIRKHFDAIWTFNLTSQDMSSEFIQGYTLTLPTTQTSHHNAVYSTPYGLIYGHGITTYNGYRDYNIPDRYAPVSYCTVRFTMYDIHTNRIVWDRIDSRRRSNDSIFSDSMPEDVYRRIISSYADEARRRFNIK